MRGGAGHGRGAPGSIGEFHEAADVNSDGRTDLAIVNSDVYTVTVLLDTRLP